MLRAAKYAYRGAQAYNAYRAGKSVYQAVRGGTKRRKLKKGTQSSKKRRSRVSKRSRNGNSQASWDRDGSGVAYKNHSITYKKTKWAKTYQKLTNLGEHSIIFSGGSHGLQGVQVPSYVVAVTTPELIPLINTLQDGVPVPVNKRALKFSLNSIQYDIEFNNCGPAAIEVDIYYLVDKITSVTTPGTPVQVWTNALADEAGTTITPTTATPWGVPTTTKSFNLHYYTKKFTKSLSPGEKIKLTLKHSVNRILDYQYLQRFFSIKGITSHIMVVQRGTICDGNNDPLVSVARQTLCRTKLIWLTKYKLVGQLLNNIPRIQTISNQLPGASVNPLYDQNEGVGAPQNTEDGTEYA